LAATLAVSSGCARRDVAAPPPAPTWALDIAPILYRHCAVCHRPGSVGPFSLLAYEDARLRARLVAEMVEQGRMPPFLPDRDFGRFQNARGLEPEEIEAVVAWAGAGAPAGDLAHAPAPPVFADGFELGEADLVVEMPEAFELPAEGADVYRNFLVRLPVAPGTRIRALELDPGNRRVVHHAAVLADTTGSARRLESRDSAPGYEEMVGGSAPGGHFVGWTPGRGAIVLEEDMPWTIEEGTDLVLQLHLLPSGRPEAVRARVGLWFTDRLPERSPTMLHLLATTLDIPAGESRYAAHDELVLPVDVVAYSVYPHAHYLGRRIEAWAELPEGSIQPLLRISDWDFDWQDEYRYAEPVALPAGSRLRLELAYDNSGANPRNPSAPPRRVLWGPSSHDEMGDLWLKVVALRPGERAELEETLRRHERERFRAGYGLRVRVDPADFEAHARLGIGYVQDGRFAEALPHLEAALASRPDAGDLNYNAAVALAALGRRRDAVARYEKALAADPGDSRTHNSIAAALLADGAVERALAHYRRAVALRPASADLHANLGLALARSGDLEGAEASYREALRLDPRHVLAHLSYGGLLSTRGREEDAAAWFRAALDIEPDRFEAHVNLARSLARVGRFEEASSHLRRALESRPGDGEVHYLLGLTLVRVERLDEAIEAFEAALRIDAGNVLARQDLAHLLLVVGQPERALERLASAPAGPALESVAGVRYTRALALLDVGRSAEAMVELRAAVRLDPGHSEAAALLDTLR
ncbi:MAG TPA: tetratricopeptide repeat protein, partial [Thermoanaerobaculia bacterium]|nr:tetratricopeptide repeat protein [Thermoanaerobaculia bacterium]